MNPDKLLQHFMCATAAVSVVNLALWAFGDGTTDHMRVGLVGLAMFGTYVYAWHIHKEPGQDKKPPKRQP